MASIKQSQGETSERIKVVQYSLDGLPNIIPGTDDEKMGVKGAENGSGYVCHGSLSVAHRR